MKVGFFFNSDKFINSLELIKKFLEKYGAVFSFYAQKEHIEKFSLANCFPLDENGVSSLDLIFSIGGDGTILSTLRTINYQNIPVLGIKMGFLGFLAAVEFEKFEKVVQMLVEKNFICEEKRLLETKIFDCNSKEIFSGFALNDLVIEREDIARMLWLDVYIDDVYLTSYHSNGIIVSTPTGSTAYNLSSAGPIVYPDVDCLILNPICPHSLSQRPVIISDKKTVVIKERLKRGKVGLTLDGQVQSMVDDSVFVVTKLSDKKIRLVRFPEDSFAKILREKLGWGN